MGVGQADAGCGRRRYHSALRDSVNSSRKWDMVWPATERSRVLVTVGLVIAAGAAWYLVLRKPEEPPTLSEQLEATLHQVNEYIEDHKHEIDVLEDLSVSLMELRDEVERNPFL